MANKRSTTKGKGWLKKGYRYVKGGRIVKAKNKVAGDFTSAIVRDLLGHSTIMMTERYAHLAPARVAAAVELLDGSGIENRISHSNHSGSNVITINATREA